MIRAQLAYVTGRGSDAPPLLLNAAQRLEPIDAPLARATYLEALTAGLIAGRLADGGVADVARAARASPRPATLRLPDLLLDGLAAYTIDGYTAALPILRRAIGTARRAASSEEQQRWLYQSCAAAVCVWDDESWELLSTRHLEAARAAGALNELPLGLGLRAVMHVFLGELTAAESTIQQLQAVTRELQTTDDIGARQYIAHVVFLLAAFRGDQAVVDELGEVVTRVAVTRGEGAALAPVIHGDCGRRRFGGLRG